MPSHEPPPNRSEAGAHGSAPAARLADGLLIRPAWAVPAGVGALMTTRAGGVSGGAYASMNVGVAVKDDPEAVAENRRRAAAWAGVPLAYLRQVHGSRVVRVPAEGEVVEADASWADAPGRACAIQVADCMPVLFAAANGGAVGAAHAGWRGLAAGVLENTLAAVCAAARCAAAEVHAWLGPRIGPQRFEVSADVLEAFEMLALPQAFVPHTRADGSAAWLANLPLLARARLERAGLRHITEDPGCTFSEPSRFFSFRRDGITGRMVAAIWLAG